MKENRLRLNVQKGAKTMHLPTGREVLKQPIMSETLKAGPIFREVQKHMPWANQVTVNKNFASTPHRDKGKHGQEERHRPLRALFGRRAHGAHAQGGGAVLGEADMAPLQWAARRALDRALQGGPLERGGI